jgi:hypothetical protein
MHTLVSTYTKITQIQMHNAPPLQRTSSNLPKKQQSSTNKLALGTNNMQFQHNSLTM